MTDRHGHRDAAGPGETGQTPAEPSGSLADEPSSLEDPRKDVPDETSASSRRPGRFSTKSVIEVGARGIIGALLVGVAIVAVTSATALTGPIHAVTPPTVTVTPVPTVQQRVCPGPLLRLGDDAGQGASTATSVGNAAVSFASIPAGAESADLAATDDTAGVAPLQLTLPPATAGSTVDPKLAGSQTQNITTGDLVGLSAGECAEASGDTWLVGGATDVGRTTIITLSNPTPVNATVALSIFGEAGQVDSSGAEGIVVPPGTQRILSLAAFAPGILSPVVRVESRGGQVVANLQQSIVRTLAPGGVEIVGATAPPAMRTLIPGLVVTSADGVEGVLSEPGFADIETVVRLLAPGDDDATATVTVTPENDSVEATTFDIDLPAGEVSEVPVAGLVNGTYSVAVESDVPVVAGARVSTVTATGAADFAWLGSSSPLGDPALVRVAAGPSPRLHLANPTDTNVSVTVESGAGGREVTVPAGGSVSTTVTAGSNAAIGASGLIGAVTYSGPGRLAALGLTTPGPGATDITVYR